MLRAASAGGKGEALTLVEGVSGEREEVAS
jgi:hypothetical protein